MNSRQYFEESISLDGPPDATVTVGKRNYEYYSGNGFFGLQAHPDLIASVCESVLKYGLGTATTRSSFTSPPVFDVENRLADIFETERGFYFASGYLGNHILLDSLTGTFDRVFIDESSHPSLFDSLRYLHGPKMQPIVFRHGNYEEFERLLKENLQPKERPLLLSDGLFAALGTLAPLDKYVSILSEYEGASILIDDVCGFGVLGNKGRGTLEHFGIDPSMANRTVMDISQYGELTEIANSVPVKLFFTVSMSKAVGGYGGGIAGSTMFIEHLQDCTKVLTAASSPPSPIATATSHGLAALFDNDNLRNRLRENTKYLKRKLREVGLETDDGQIPIVLLRLGSAVNMRRIQRELADNDILITYLPRIAGLGSEGSLRIAVFATHTTDMIDRLAETLEKIV